MADYNDLLKLEKKTKQPPLSVPSPLPTQQPLQGPDAGKPANLQADKQVSIQASKPASLQAGIPAKPEKYSSYLLAGYKKRLKQIALDTERKEYEVLQEAIEYYFSNIAKKK